MEQKACQVINHQKPLTMSITYKAEEFFKIVGETTVMAPLPHKVWSGIFIPVDVTRLKKMIQDDSTYQYWIQFDERDGLIYIDGMGKEAKSKKDISPH